MKTLFISLIMVYAIYSTGQTKVLVSPTLAYQNDSIVKNYIIPSLSSYLHQSETDNSQNQFISAENKIQNDLLTDELRGMQKSGRFKNEFFYKPTLINVIPQKENSYFLQLSYIDTADSTTILVGNFDLVAKKSEQNKYVFSSPIVQNTSQWKTKKIGITEFHFKNELNESKANEYSKMVDDFDKKLNNKNQSIQFYACNDATEVLKIIGVQYKSQYNGLNTISLGSNDANNILYISSAGGESFTSFDPHDLWHDRLAQHIPRNQVNKSIDEACAYLYGGSWGLSWKQIFNDFKAKVSIDNQKDWLTEYGKYQNFGVSQELHLYPEYVINALLVQKIEKEKGFPAVLEFLKTGKNDQKDTTNANYFTALQKLTGITKDNYSTEVWKLIHKEK